MAGHMPSDSTDHSAFDATFGLRGINRSGSQ